MLGKGLEERKLEGARELFFVLTLGALGCAFLWELIGSGWVPVARDMQMFFLPQRHLVWEALQDGRIPLWTPFYGTGSPLMANFQSGIFYPPHWLFALLPFYAAFNTLLIGHFVLGGLATYTFARAAKLDRPSAAIAATVFMLGGYFASLLNLANALQAAAWVPLIGTFLIRYLRKPRAASFLGLVGTGVLGFLAGEPQTFVLGIAAVGAFVGLRASGLRGTDSLRVAAWPGTLLGLIGVVVLAAGLAMVQLLPTIELIGQSSRAGGGLGYAEATAFSLAPARLLHLVFPPDFSDPVYAFGIKTQIGAGDPWLFSVYLGLIALLLAACAWTDRERRLEVAAWSVASVMGILLALGDHLPVYHWAFDHLPGVSAFRYPEKFFLLTGMGVAMLAGYGAHTLQRFKGERTFLVSAGVALACVLAAKAYWLVGKESFYELAGPLGGNFLVNYDFAWEVWGAKLNLLLILLSAAVPVGWLHRTGHLKGRMFVGLLWVLVCTDLVLAHRRLTPVVEADFFAREPQVGRHVPLDEVRRMYRYRSTPFGELSGIIHVRAGASLESQKWLWQQVMMPNTSQLYRVLAPDTWDAIHLRRQIDYSEFQRILPDARRRWRLLKLTSVKYLYSGVSLEVASGEYRWAVALDSLGGFLYELEDPVPRAHVVPRATFHATDLDAINRALEADFDPRAEVALVGQSPRLESEGNWGGANVGTAGQAADEEDWVGEARIVEDSGEIVRIAVGVSAPGWLVLTDSYYPGWTAEVDGNDREIQLANYFFRAVPVGPGDREVVFRYRSHPYEAGRWISAATLLLLIVGLGAVWIRSRRRELVALRADQPGSGFRA